MLIVDGKLISDQLFTEQFTCNLQACKGACCHEGDSGAPLEYAELAILAEIYPRVKPYLSPRSIAAIEEQGLYSFNNELGEYAANCIDDADCVFMNRDALGIAYCGIERAWRDGKIPFRKPISCQLYPIRVLSDEEHGFEALNYDQWDICSAACDLGRKERMPVFRFVREAIIRKWGEDFYEQLEAAWNQLYGGDQVIKAKNDTPQA